MDARKGNIFEILNGNKQFIIPVYQRYYSWGEEQCKRLWDDIVNMQKNVRVLDPKEPFEGKAMGITPKGELIVDTWESRKLVSSGEVSVRGIYGYV